MESLHKGVKWKFRFESYFGLFILLVFLAFPLSAAFTLSGYPLFLLYLLPFLLVYIIIAEIFIHWAYKNWKYEFTKDSLKIEKGVIIKRYKSIPYERIQNVDITRGILARIIGFSTIDIQTAGYSAYNMHGARATSEGHLPAVSTEHAEEIREFLVKRISHNKQGL